MSRPCFGEITKPMQQILVIKIGGSAGVDVESIVRDAAQIAQSRPVVLVHGVSARMAQLSDERGLTEEMLTSPSGHQSRYTPPPVRDLFVEAATQINEEIVALLTSHGIESVGLTDNIIVQGERKKAIRAVVNGRVRVVRDDHTGKIKGVNAVPLFEALNSGRVAVVPPLANSDDGWLNIDGDRAAAAIAGAIQAEDLVILSNVRGLYQNFPDEASFVNHVSAGQIEQAMSWAEGRMKRKVLSAQEALDGGANRIIISDGRVENPVSEALSGAGTFFTGAL